MAIPATMPEPKDPGSAPKDPGQAQQDSASAPADDQPLTDDLNKGEGTALTDDPEPKPGATIDLNKEGGDKKIAAVKPVEDDMNSLKKKSENVVEGETNSKVIQKEEMPLEDDKTAHKTVASEELVPPIAPEDKELPEIKLGTNGAEEKKDESAPAQQDSGGGMGMKLVILFLAIAVLAAAAFLTYTLLT